ncbi:MAG: deoxyhypusine synthase [Bdellovibrionales bacterium RIFOXYD12_FULL_39_22]|nr:MAG: deoxyhypusine synthase [Bdellovibrionales bacterium RIFOXYB1_FULL_39_21]OFZ43412.1 MAG: deoxyhypusine synthase [Bdellovibrionales bacterium RIFOXYC12_FULL_39_17]OFZ46955.1 MAG: deoxyhypusine synthase [Bdellovibrionales bacterium RIFOXYC1_FULL_39_130]OFZ76152.1 MAG: deoxyhypusine synthase [Bdellovibrionales bacterium RIFOXYD1_FULL_39_84]OFZ94387.1 MAG: deoxyhypusine synthase [Bdellovibrionales bacterium RIFOXYD12_FULL_39_22]HLE10573.1 deoxyhypusine synthase family protein [Bacteriovorac
MNKTNSNKGPISKFITEHYLHFNAAALVDAAKGYEKHLADGGKMFVTLAGAMSTAELGKSLAEMIRQDKIAGISCTGANLEEDIFNLVAYTHYKRIPNYRDLTKEDEMALHDEGHNRVTDTCIPEEEAMRKIEHFIYDEWYKAEKNNETHPPHYYFWKLFDNPKFREGYETDPKNSWMLAAYQKNIPIFTPGWEDSTLGNIFAGKLISKKLKSSAVMESGVNTMVRLAAWYQEICPQHSIGFFQIGGGIAGDFPICVVPMINQDLQMDVRKWGYFCQISDSTTSYGSYSGAVPNEKITWGKLDITSPSYIIESDATIVAPLIFAYILGW